VHRCVGEVTVACRYAKAGTGHWSSALPMPDGIAFNVYHKRLGVPVAHGATRSDRHDACVLSSSSGDAAGERGVHQSLFVGETYTIEVPATVQLQMAKKDFVVTSEGHVVSVVLARRVGRVMVHLLPGESDLPVPTSVMLQLEHRGLDQRVMPAFPVGADRAELHGEDALLVGETYELSGIIPTSTEFVVADGQVVKVWLPIEHATAVVSLIFRAQPPPVPEAKGGGGSSVAYRAASIELPEGLVYEVRHKATERVVATGATRQRDVAPRVSLPSCDFYVRSPEAQEVTMQVCRSTCGLGSAFKALEASTDHWAAWLPLPREV